MKVWRLGYDSNNYEGFKVADGDWSIADKFVGKTLLSEWNPLALEVYEEAPRSDAPSFMGCAPVFSIRTVEVLNSLIDGFVEVLPTQFEREKYFIINVLTVLNCIDYDNSKVVRYTSGRVMKFEKYAFITDIVKEQHIFKIAEIPKQAVFISDEFRDRILSNNLVGFKFEEIWDSN